MTQEDMDARRDELKKDAENLREQIARAATVWAACESPKTRARLLQSVSAWEQVYEAWIEASDEAHAFWERSRVA